MSTSTSTRLTVPGLERLDAAEAERWMLRLERTARPCGCKSGAGLTLAGLVGWPVWVIASVAPRSAGAVLGAVAAYPVVLVVCGVVGKVAGIAVGRRRHRRLRRRLERRVAVHPTTGG
jgi:hypothetical protein